MRKYFNINFEFNHKQFEEKVEHTALNGKGYCCFVDGTSLVYSYKNEGFRNVLNNSLANSCDGSYIALLASRIHKTKLKEYIGPDFFNKYIYKKGSHLILGNTEQVFKRIQEKVELQNNTSENLHFMEVPFRKVEEFDYTAIAKEINDLKPNYIWVSLGAPKQELFMSNLLPHINQGAMLGVGAALNYFTGQVKDIPNWAKKLHLIWLYRIFTEPKKQLKRCTEIATVLPKMYKEEKKRWSDQG